MEKLSVAIADDNEIMLQLLGDIIESDDELNVVGTAKDGEEAYRVIKTKEPDIRDFALKNKSPCSACEFQAKQGISILGIKLLFFSV